MKVYLVSSGSYSDYQLHKVFATLEAANTYADLIHGDISEFETSDNAFQEEVKKMRPYTVVFFNYIRQTKNSSEMHIMNLSTWLESNEDMYQQKTASYEEEFFNIGKSYNNTIYDAAYGITPLNEKDNSNFFSVTKHINRYHLSFKRIFEGHIELDEAQLRASYEQVIQDTFHQCLKWYQEEKWELEKINEWLRNEFPTDNTFLL